MKKLFVVLFIVIICFSSIACNDTSNLKNNDTNNKERDVVLYFADEKLKNLVAEKREVIVKDKSIEQVVIDQLIKGPSLNKLKRTIPSNVNIIGLEIQDNVAIVNISSENLYGGSTEEVFLITSIVKSLVSLDNVDKVKFNVDGEEAETLMGHLSIMEPFTEKTCDDLITVIDEY